MSLRYGTKDQWASEVFREIMARDLNQGLDLVRKAIECLPIEHPARPAAIRAFMHLSTIHGEILNEKPVTQY